MRREDFKEPLQGELVTSPQGVLAFVPAPLPPALAFDAALVRALSAADTSLAELSGMGRQVPNPHLLMAPYMRQEAVLSSRMGSIGARSHGGMWLYRASKAALNSVLKDAAIVLADKAICVALHPGWVRTDMGGAGADIDVADSASGIRRTLAGLRAQDSGSFLNFDGTPLAW